MQKFIRAEGQIAAVDDSISLNVFAEGNEGKQQPWRQCHVLFISSIVGVETDSPRHQGALFISLLWAAGK